MILKSYEVEKNFSKLKSFRSILIYGENIGLKETIKKNIAGLYKNAEIIKIFQEDISKNKEVVKDEILNCQEAELLREVGIPDVPPITKVIF